MAMAAGKRSLGGAWSAVLAALGAGALGGALGGALDALRAGPELARFLPDGTARLWGFLMALYGATFAAAGALLAGLLALLLLGTPLGALWPEPEPAAPQRLRFGAVVFGALGGAAAFGGLLYGPTRWALHRFHHPGLTALLVGAVAAGLALGCGVLGLLAATLASRGGGVTVRRRGPLALYATGWTLGLLLLAGGVAVALRVLMQNPRMSPELRALNLALYAPALGLVALALGHGLGSLLAALVGEPGALPARPNPGALRRFLGGAWAVLLLPLSVVGLLGTAAAVQYAPVLRLLDLRPLVTAAVATACGLLVLRLLARSRLASRRALALLLLPPGLWAAAVGLGRADRVRKAALTQAPLALHLVQGAAAVFDLDRDGAAARFTIGGSDCDDLDPEIHPGAFDWPDNGIDENCNGHDARLAPFDGAQGERSFDGAQGERSGPPLPAALPARPNVVLITIDALRADHTPLYGYGRRTTPQLQRLFDEDPDAVLFESAWAHAPSTRYSVPAILTGRYPSTIAWGSHLVHWPPQVLPENRLLSEALAARGYATTALLSYHYFEPTWGLARGFSDYDTHLMTLHSMGGDPAATSGSSARELADLALAKLPALVAPGEARPFFLWVHFYDPHFRYEPHPPPPGEPAFGSDEAAGYDGEIRYTDQHLGRLLDALRQGPAWARTVVVVTADHGEGLGEHGIPPDRRHGYHLYANQTKVPLLLRVPGLHAARTSTDAGKRIAAPVGHVDLMPTVLQLCGAARPAELSGRSLLPLLLGQPGGPGASGADARPVFQEVMYEGPTVRKALVTRRWHLIENLIPDGTTELYDLQADPGEEHDVQGLPRTLDLERGLRQTLAAWIDDSAVPADFAARVRGNLSRAPLAAPTPLGATLGGWLEIVGVEVRTPGVRRGQDAEVALVLRARRRVPAGWRLFFHLRGANGGFLNLDHDLLQGLLPPQRLRPGEYVRDLTRAAIPTGFPAGPATLLVGLFQRAQRAEVSGPAGVALPADRAVQVATIQVQ